MTKWTALTIKHVDGMYCLDDLPIKKLQYDTGLYSLESIFILGFLQWYDTYLNVDIVIDQLQTLRRSGYQLFSFIDKKLKLSSIETFTFLCAVGSLQIKISYYLLNCLINCNIPTFSQQLQLFPHKSKILYTHLSRNYKRSTNAV